MTNEAWRAVSGYPQYEVSDTGRVRNTKTRLVLKPQHLAPKAVRGLPGKGHVAVRLYRDGLPLGQDIGIHRLVLSAFVGECPEGMQGCHGDNDPANNRLANLRWDTPTGNQADRLSHGTDIRGEKNVRSLLTRSAVEQIRARRKSGETMKSIAAAFGIARTTVSAVVHNATWKHVGRQDGGGLSL